MQLSDISPKCPQIPQIERISDPQEKIKQNEPETKKEIKILHEITDEEFDRFAAVLKNKINLPIFIKEHFKTVTGITPVSESTLNSLRIDLPDPEKKKLTNKTLFLDLDNTLVYVVTNSTYIKMNIPKSMDVRNTLYTDPKESKPLLLNIILRPYALDMLKQLSPYYEIIVFTAANKSYGDAVINKIDPYGNLIDYRLYRDSCIRDNNVYIKDLRIIKNRNIENMIIVDDCISSFCNHLENGIFIAPFGGSPTDGELGVLWIFLRQILDSTDVRIPIAAKFNLPFLFKMYIKTLGQK